MKKRKKKLCRISSICSLSLHCDKSCSSVGKPLIEILRSEEKFSRETCVFLTSILIAEGGTCAKFILIHCYHLFIKNHSYCMKLLWEQIWNTLNLAAALKFRNLLFFLGIFIRDKIINYYYTWQKIFFRDLFIIRVDNEERIVLSYKWSVNAKNF